MARIPDTDGEPVNSAIPRTSLVSTGLHSTISTPGPAISGFPRLGRYQLLSRLAVGGMAEVYLARQGELSGFKTLVVVKKVLPHLACKPDFIAMFLDEARIASMLDHPNVVRINEVGRADDEYFLAMELVQGKPLASLLRHAERNKLRLPQPLAALIVANAAAGLHHAHQLTGASGESLGLVHRDVSPQNIMVSFEGSVKVIDFGIARALGRISDTASGALKGKLGYMAPEQARGEAVDARADIFSLGVVLWESIAGRRLFQRDNELATLRAVVYEPIPDLSTVTEVSPALNAIVKLAFARDVDERFQTAEEMRIALEQWMFSSGGTSSHELSALMKEWFPNDFAQWQRAARLALDMEGSDARIDVAFPDLTGSKSGNLKTGNRPITGVSKIYWESPSRVVQSQAPASPSLHFLLAKLGKYKRFLLPLAAVLALATAWLGIVVYAGRKAAPEVAPAPLFPAPSRPKIDILPGENAGPAQPALTGDVSAGASDGHKPTQNQEILDTAENRATAKRKNRTTSGEKRAILHEQSAAKNDPTRRTPLRHSPSGRKSKKFLPNPF